MKILDLKTININNARTLTSKKSIAQLVRFDLDTYAVVDPQIHKTVMAFHSFAFSALIDNFDSDIVDVKIDTITYETFEEKSQVMEVRILTSEGELYVLDSHGNLSEIVPLKMVPVTKRNAHPVAELWDELNEAMHRRLMVSKELLPIILPFIDSCGSTEIINRMLSDLESTEQDIEIGTAVIVSGEWTDFAALELRCGRIVMMTIDEATPDETAPF